MYEALARMFGFILMALEIQDIETARKVLEVEDEIDRLDRNLAYLHTQWIEKDECNALAGVVFLDYVSNFEKVGDHLTNVAEALISLRGPNSVS